ncbi:tRNA(Met) cytidine acetate ligase [Fusobacterium russii]|uniref:tRNA(Met) cytidine acetate ligase n=1 Tax=Fusobacterium russii TaxID=854 RepID=UPI0003A09F19|nr:nucleotidyltransferase family protein [Fusobacterium russii]
MKKIIGLIVEYNPFHNGHLYHIQKIEELYPESIKIAVMSGDFVQRGEPAIISKNRRAKIGIEMGVDLIIELPAFYSTQSAEIFARAAVGMLDIMGCESFVFGSETDDIQRLEKIATITLTEEFNKNIKKFLKEGYSYPTAFSKSLLDEKIESNDMLGIEYIKALRFWKSEMKAKTILRKSAKYYGENLDDNIAGASIIRQKILNKEKYSQYLVDNFSLEGPFAFWEDFYPYLRYSILFNYKGLSSIQDIERGLEQRIFKSAQKNIDYKGFLNGIITKRYTNARLQRVFIHILIGLTVDITKRWAKEIPYIRILEFSKKGQLYLNKIKKIDFPIISTKKNIQKNLSKEAQEIFFWNERASDLYNWIVGEKI